MSIYFVNTIQASVDLAAWSKVCCMWSMAQSMFLNKIILHSAHPCRDSPVTLSLPWH